MSLVVIREFERGFAEFPAVFEKRYGGGQDAQQRLGLVPGFLAKSSVVSLKNIIHRLLIMLGLPTGRLREREIGGSGANPMDSIHKSKILEVHKIHDFVNGFTRLTTPKQREPCLGIIGLAAHATYLLGFSSLRLVLSD